MHFRRTLAAVALLSLGAAAFGGPTHTHVAAASQVTVTYWTHVNAPAQKVEKKLIAQFEAQNPTIKINYVVVDFNSLPTKLTTALAGGSGPDIFNYFRSFAPALVQRDLIAPVDFKAFGVANQQAFMNRYLPSVIGGYTFNNTVYGIPHEVSNFAFWVNGSEFRAAGLDPVKDFPKTWADVARLGKKLTISKGGKVVQEGISLPLYNVIRDTLTLDSMARQAGGGLFSEDGKKAMLNSPSAIKALQTWSDMVHVQKINDPALGPTASTDNTDLFGNGTAAMINVGGSWLTAILQQTYPKVYADYNVGPEPRYNTQLKIGSDMYGFGLFVTKASKNQAAAWKFSRFLVDHSNDYFSGAGIWLGDKAPLSPALTKTLKKWSVFASSFAEGSFLPPVTNYNQLANIIERAIERSVLNGESPKDSLNQAQQEATPLMQ
jgi:multiple sugar transport system substrate-binding protein